MLRAIALTVLIAAGVIYYVHLQQQQWQVQVCVASQTGGNPSCLSDGDTLLQSDLAFSYIVAHNDAGDGFPTYDLQMHIDVLDASGNVLANAGNAILPVPASITESRHSWYMPQVFSTGNLRILSGQTYRIELYSVKAGATTKMGTDTFHFS